MSSLKDLKPGDHVLVSYGTYVRGMCYTSYAERQISHITDSGLIIVDRMEFDPDSGLESNCCMARRQHIAMLDDKEALNVMERTRRIKKIDSVLSNIHSCYEWNLTYDQAVEIANIMGWEV